MTSRILAILIAFAVSNASFAQENFAEFPNTMLGFLRPGMHLGITSVEGTTSVIIRTYSDDGYAVARDLAKQLGASLKSASSVAETNTTVRAELQAYVSRLSLPAASAGRIMIRPFARTLFGKVVVVGDDYFLLDLDGEQQPKRIVPKASVGTIYLDANPIRFINPSARVRTANGG